jgi:transposase
MSKMNEHIQNLLLERQYSEDLKDEAVLRVLFNGESAVDVSEAMEIQSVATVNLWVNAYRRKIEEGLITLTPMTEKQKKDLYALQQRNKELERAVKESNLMIHALNTLIDVAEKDLKIPIRKKRGTKRS